MTPSEELLSAYLDDELGAQDRADVERRLASDAQWRDTLEKLQEVRSWMQELPTVVPNRPKSISQMLAEHKPTAPEGDVRLNDSATLSSAPTSWKWMMALAATGLIAIASTFWWMSGMNQQIAWLPSLSGPSLEGPSSVAPASVAPASAAPASSAQASSAPDSAAVTEDTTMDASASSVAVEAETETAAGAVTLSRSQAKVLENAQKPDEPLPPQAMAESASARGMGGLAPSPKGLPGAAEGLDGAVEGPQVLNDPAPMRASRAGERRIRNAPSGLGSSDSVAGGMGAGGMGAGGVGAGGVGAGSAGELNAGELAAEGVGVTGGMLGGSSSSSQPSVPTISRFLSEKSNAAESSLFFLATPYSNDEKPLLLEPADAADAASMVSPDTLAKAADAEANGSMIEEMIYLVVPTEAFEDLEKNWKPGISERPSPNQLAQEAPLGTSKDSGLGKNEEELKRFGKPNDVWLLEMSPENYEALRLRWSESGFDVTEILDDRKLMLARRGAVTGLGAQAAEGAQTPQPSGTTKQPEASVGAAQPDFIFILLQRR